MLKQLNQISDKLAPDGELLSLNENLDAIASAWSPANPREQSPRQELAAIRAALATKEALIIANLMQIEAHLRPTESEPPAAQNSLTRRSP